MVINLNTYKSFLLPCRFPKLVQNSNGDLIPTSCGRCPDCMNRKSSRYSMLCCKESEQCLKTFFVTLTYNDLNAPVLKLVENKEDSDNPYISMIDVTRRKVHPRNPNCETYRNLPTYGQELHRINCSFDSPIFKKFYAKSKKESNIFKTRKFKHLYYLSPLDLERFLKRLRFNIRKDYGSEIRYFAVGEYSPQHFRPHYHLLLYVNDPRLYSVIVDYVNKSWEYGITYCKPALTSSGVASYVSSYTNSFTKLPTFLSGRKISPFNRHSRFLGSQDNIKVSEIAYSTERFSFEPFDVSIDGTLFHVSYTSQISNYLFPRCYGYDRKDESIHLQLYTCFQKLSREYKTDYVPDLVKHLLLNPYIKYNLSLLKQIDLTPIEKFKPFVFVDAFETTDGLNDDYHISVYNKVYSVILLSRHFTNLTRYYSGFNGLPQYKRNLLLVRKIDDFYYQKKQWQLKLQYQCQHLYCEDYGITLPNSDNKIFDTTLFYHYTSKDHFDLDSKDKEYQTYYYNKFFKNHSVAKAYFAYQDKIFSEKVKNKHLNDENDIFCNLSLKSLNL